MMKLLGLCLSSGRRRHFCLQLEGSELHGSFFHHITERYVRRGKNKTRVVLNLQN